MEQRTIRPRIADVAREAGVSQDGRVVRVQQPGSAGARDGRRGSARWPSSWATRPHPVARMLTQRQTLTIGVLTPAGAVGHLLQPVLRGVQRRRGRCAAEEYGYGLHFISPLHGILARAMSRATVDGVVAIGLSDDHPEVEQIRRAGVPIVLVDSTALPEHGSVEIDDVGGARAAAEHLIGLGHRDVLVIGVEPPAPSVADGPGRRHRPPAARLPRGVRGRSASRSRTSGSSSARPASTAASPRSTAPGRTASARPAVLAMSDAMAIGAMRALRDLRLTIPGDVSVVGFDDIDLAPHVDPPLTTVHQPIRRKGEEAVRLLLTVVQRRDLAKPEHRRLETRLIVRGSTGPVPHQRQEEVAGN